MYDGNVGIDTLIESDQITFEGIRLAWDAFQPYLDSDTPPPLTDQDTKVRTDHAWREAAEAYRGWKDVVDEAQAKADAAKATLIELATHTAAIAPRRSPKSGKGEPIR